MKLLVEYSNKKHSSISSIDGIILPLKGFSVESMNYYTLEEIKDICKNESCDVFVKLNKNFMNEDLDSLKEILLELEELKIAGIFFYDLAVLEFKRELNLKVPLIWNQTHMVNNYRTCNYYYSRGVEYALLGKEITLEEILEIASKSNISTMVEVVSKPSVAFSKRKLLTNYFTDANLEKKNELTIKERGTNEDYHLYENEDGTSFFLDIVTNGTGVIKDLYDGGVDFIILREYGLEDSFEELVKDTSNYLKEGCSDSKFVEKYKKLGDSTNFFFKKTIYKVKKNG